MSKPLYTPASTAVREIRSGNRVFIHGSAATTVTLVRAMQERHTELQDVELVSITTLGDVDFNKPEYRKSFFSILYSFRLPQEQLPTVMTEIMYRYF